MYKRTSIPANLQFLLPVEYTRFNQATRIERYNKMKLLSVCLCALFTVGFSNVLKLEKSAEDGDITRFEVANDEGGMEKRYFLCTTAQSCQSGYVVSKYCTYAAKRCFRSGQLVHVNFKPAFQKPPQVTVGLTRIDTHKDHNVRVFVSPEHISRTGFYVKFAPWDTSITYQLGVRWMACP